jgi:hypothetical protein
MGKRKSNVRKGAVVYWQSLGDAPFERKMRSGRVRDVVADRVVVENVWGEIVIVALADVRVKVGA